MIASLIPLPVLQDAKRAPCVVAISQKVKRAAREPGQRQSYSVKDVIAAAEKVSGCSSPTEGAPRRVEDPPISCGQFGSRSCAAALESSPAPELDTQIQSAWNWMNKNALR
jgi:UDP-glucose 4-epimerase